MTEDEKLLEELLKKQAAGQLKPSDRFAIPPQPMPVQDEVARRSNIEEVALGYTETSARLEAMRCLQCKKAPCVEGCPVSIRIREFVDAVAMGNFAESFNFRPPATAMTQADAVFVERFGNDHMLYAFR